MAYCTCELKLMDGSSFVIADANPCLSHKDKSVAGTFRLRTWIVDEGLLYNSYREDTGTNVEHGLVFKNSPWHYNQYICDLSSFLLNEKLDVLVGVNLFADGILTNAQGRMRFKKAPPSDPEEAFQRMNAAIRKSLSQNKDIINPEAYVESVEKKIKDEWLVSFAIAFPEFSSKFEIAVQKAVKAIDDDRRAHERQERQQTMTSLQRAEDQAKDAMEQVRVLSEYIKELEIEARRAQIRYQTEIAALRAQLQRQPMVNLSHSSVSNKPTEWACTVCTFLNPIDKVKCSMCTAARLENSKEAEGKHN